jgi:hypothetical protein
MSKLIAQGFLSLLISLGLVTGARAGVRGEVKELWQETKAVVHEAFEFAAGTVGEVTSQVPTEVNVDLNLSAEANADTSADVSSSDVQAEGESETDAAASVATELEDGSFFLNLGGDADAGLSVGVGLGK